MRKKVFLLMLCVFVTVNLVAVLFACADSSDITVTFETNGGSSITQFTFRNEVYEINMDDFVTTRENYAFKGWYFDSQLTNKLQNYEDGRSILPKPTKSINLYAAWAPVYLEVADGEYYVVNWNNDVSAEIPESFQGKPITGIADGAFGGLKTASIVIPSTVKFIGNFAFSASRLTEITIPENVTWIGESAFRNCELLKTIRFAENARLDFIGSYAFEGTAVEEVALPDLNRVGKKVFQNCIQLKNVEFAGNAYPDDIGANDLFSGCSKIEHATGNLSKINLKTVFQDSAWFHSLSGIGIIYENNVAVAAGDTISRVTFSEGTVEIAAGCLKDKINVENIDLPSTLKRIGDEAFLGTSVKKIVLPEGLESIGNNAFPKGVKISSLPSTLKTIGSGNFIENSEITSLPDALVSVGADSFRGCAGIQTLPQRLQTVGTNAFAECGGIEELPNSLYYAGGGAFRDTPWWKKQPAGVVYCNKSAIGFVGNIAAGGVLVIREGTEVVGEGVFQDGVFDEIRFPSTLKRIERNAFESVKVPKIVLPEGLTYLGKFAFFDAEASELVLPESLEVIEPYALAGIGIRAEEGAPKRLATMSLPKYTKYIEEFSLVLNVNELKLPENFLNREMLSQVYFNVLYLKEKDWASVDIDLKSYLNHLKEIERKFEIRYGW